MKYNHDERSAMTQYNLTLNRDNLMVRMYSTSMDLRNSTSYVYGLYRKLVGISLVRSKAVVFDNGRTF